MTNNKRSDSYVFTADAMSAGDMLQIDVVKKTIKASNKLAMQSYKWACKRAEYNGTPMPQKPKTYRVRLMGRGPRKASYEAHLREGGYSMWQGFNAYLPQKYAERFDVYIAEKL